jgi:hypothetical protein
LRGESRYEEADSVHEMDLFVGLMSKMKKRYRGCQMSLIMIGIYECSDKGRLVFRRFVPLIVWYHGKTRIGYIMSREDMCATEEEGI